MNNRETCELGFKHLEAGRASEAQQLFREVLARDAKHAGALHGMGRAAQLEGNHPQAVDCLLRAVTSDRRRVEAHFHLALSQHAIGQVDDALRSLRAAVMLDAKVARYHAALGTLLDSRGLAQQAVSELRTAVELDPADAIARVNLSSVLLKAEDPAGAQEQARQALALNPGLALPHVVLGQVMEFRGDPASAAAEYRATVALDPGNADAHFALSQALLKAGEFAEGWEEYEWRFATQNDPVPAPKFSTPAWDGSDFGGKALLVHAEQGLGDTIQFARYVPMLAERGIKVILRCHPALGTLMRTLKGIGSVVTGTQSIPSFDGHVPLLGLPRRFRTTLGSVPSEVPYLSAEDAKVQGWRQRLASLPAGKRIGLCWAGSTAHPRDRQRSIDPALLTTLSQCADVQWVSLQKGWRGTKPALNLHDFTGELADFSDTAALVMNLDLVISADTSVAHLAGALARPVWVMIPFVPDWRWMVGREDSPWYPTMRLFRQKAPNDWLPVLESVASGLSSFGSCAGV